MPIYFISETQPNSFYERKLPNNKYRYTGFRHNIEYCIDSLTQKSQDIIEEFLDSCSVDFLIDNEGYVINIK